MTLDEFQQQDPQVIRDQLFACCGSDAWANALAGKMPFSSLEELLNASDRIWSNLPEQEWLDAFTHHPKIGDLASLEKKFASTKHWAAGEQSGVNEATREVLEELALGNQTYEAKFGYIFIVCATGKSAGEMLSMLKVRLKNNAREELLTAMGEQNKITHIRLKKLLS